MKEIVNIYSGIWNTEHVDIKKHASNTETEILKIQKFKLINLSIAMQTLLIVYRL
jgi:hypothetical protein